MKDTKGFVPEWVLSEHWAVGRDPLNWKLYQLVGDKKTKWKVMGYYRNPEGLLESLIGKIGRVEDRGNRELIAHLENCLVVAMACSKTFLAMLKMERK